MVEAPRLKSGRFGSQSSFSPSFFASRAASLKPGPRLSEGLDSRSRDGSEVCVFTRKHGALQVRRDSIECHPNLFTLRLLSARRRFFSAASIIEVVTGFRHADELRE